jgi:hypothetical protein
MLWLLKGGYKLHLQIVREPELGNGCNALVTREPPNMAWSTYAERNFKFIKNQMGFLILI